MIHDFREYHTNILFFFPLQLSSDRGESSLVNVSETDSGALDLSSGSRDRENMKSRSSVASHISHHSSSYQSEGKDSESNRERIAFGPLLITVLFLALKKWFF